MLLLRMILEGSETVIKEFNPNEVQTNEPRLKKKLQEDSAPLKNHPFFII